MLLLGLQYIPSPSMGEGEGGGEGRRSAYAALLPHPNLGATASAEGRQFNGAPSRARVEGAKRLYGILSRIG